MKKTRSRIEEAILRATAKTMSHVEVARQYVRNTAEKVESAQPRGQNSLRTDLMMQIENLEQSLRYMGESHPQRAKSERQLQQLKVVLQRWEQVQQLQRKFTKLK